ncbi:cytochrome c3 family protein [Pelagibaculum spongiae]|uniref:Cytochrome c-type protein n=1 Tax=Pelagibaculum spongiae TaxID=2080658 RepID=A0A2V1GTP3_9GAMM|nr:cytochrome c3 family protein [Pelagibaculum spongiae]PVZ68978.1 cytochrome c-type protein NapC [Pelagibaculum spongiae]
MSIKGIISKLASPSRIALGTLLIGGFVAGIIFWGGFNTGMEATNQEQFCVGCHEMRENVFEEYKTTIHYSNRSGVRATCPDCHVPKNWTDKIIRKIQASKEVWGKLTGKIDTREKFNEHRLSMAQNEWSRMEANDSQECRNCHNFEFMDFTMQESRSGKVHQKAIDDGNTCIDCHKGIAHQLPDMSGVEGWK